MRPCASNCQYLGSEDHLESVYLHTGCSGVGAQARGRGDEAKKTHCVVRQASQCLKVNGMMRVLDEMDRG